MSGDSETTGTYQAVTAANPAIAHLEALLGEWRITLPGVSTDAESARVSYTWLEGGAFMLQRSEAPDPYPTGVAVIGCDDSTARCAMHYFDSRGVARLYEMSLSDGVLRQWREAPGFNQRFTGTFSEDGNTINATWELSEDGLEWKRDFDLVYQRVK